MSHHMLPEGVLDVWGMVAEFHRKFDCTIAESPQFPFLIERLRRLKHLDEEFNELLIADRNGDLVEVADALADIVYLVYGYAIAHGIDLYETLEEVHRSNLTKTLDDKGKIVKGEGYKKPQIAKALGWDSLDHLVTL